MDAFQIFGGALVHSLWQIALVSLALWMFLRTCPERFSQIRYGMCLAMLYLVPVLFLGTCFILSNLSSTYNYGLEDIGRPSFIYWLVFSWFIGAFISLLRLYRDAQIAFAIYRAPTRHPSDDLQNIFERLKLQLEIKSHIRLGIADHVDSPCAVGFLRPLVLLPACCLLRLSVDELEAILAHELAHIKRNDIWHGLAQSILDVIYFYHPGFRFISKQLSVERENACDDIAVSVLANPKPLATALARLGLFKSASGFVLTASSDEVFALEKRLARLVEFKRQTNTRHGLKAKIMPVMATCLIGTLIGLVSLPAISQSEKTFMSKAYLVDLKDEVCDILYTDNIYWNPKYDTSGPAKLRYSDGVIYMNENPLPEATQVTIRKVFNNYGLGENNQSHLVFWGDQIQLTLDEIAGGKSMSLYSTEPDRDQVEYQIIRKEQST